MQQYDTPNTISEVEGHTGGTMEQLRKQAFWIAASMAVVLIAFATVVYHSLEEWSWVDLFYFSTVAVTTVGFGDLVPTCDASKLFTVFYVFGESR